MFPNSGHLFWEKHNFLESEFMSFIIVYGAVGADDKPNGTTSDYWSKKTEVRVFNQPVTYCQEPCRAKYRGSWHPRG